MIVDILSWISLVAGSLFVLIGGLGLLRFPDFYSRLHATSVIDTLGAWLILLGLLMQSPDIINSLKLAIIFGLFYFANPTTSHILAKAAHQSGLKPFLKDKTEGEQQ